MARAALIWTALAAALLIPLAAAALSPLLAWRSPVYIAAGLAGVAGLGLLLLQPLLAREYLPGLAPHSARRLHRLSGILLLGAVLIHVAGLWITSPPDMIDALLFRAPTAFSAWGVIAMWALLATATLAALRRRGRIKWRPWSLTHRSLGAVIVSGTVIHALLIEGTMEPITKAALSALVLLATLAALRPPKGPSGPAPRQ